MGAGIWSVAGDIIVASRQDIRLPCHNVGDPEPKLYWSHEGKTISSTQSDR